MGKVGYGSCGELRQGLVRLGEVWRGKLRQFWFVRFRSVAVCSGVVWQLRFGCAGRGRVWLVVAVKACSGMVRPVADWQGTAVKVGLGLVWQGQAL